MHTLFLFTNIYIRLYVYLFSLVLRICVEYKYLEMLFVNVQLK